MVASLTEKQVDAMLNSCGWDRLEPFVSRTTPFLAKHVPCGKDRMITAASVQAAQHRGHTGCYHCARPTRISEQDAVDFVRTLGFEPMEPYPGQEAPWTMIHVCGAITETATFHYLHSKRRVGDGCRSCASREKGQKMALSHATATEAATIQGMYPLEPYPAFMGAPWHLRCLYCGNEGYWSYHTLTSKYQKWRCPGCKHLAQEKAALELAGRNGWTPLVSFPGLKSKWQMEHRCGLQHMVSLGDLGRSGECCPNCTTSGYRVSDPGWVYVVEFPDALKIGISNQPFQRTNQHLSHGAIGVPYMNGPVTGLLAYQVEQKYLTSWRSLGFLPAPSLVGVDGWTETVLKTDVDLAALIAALDTDLLPPSNLPLVSIAGLVVGLEQDGTKVRNLIASGHYSGRCPTGKYYVSLRDRKGELLGGAVFSVTSYPGVPSSVWIDGNQQNTVELRRFYLKDHVGTNAESWFLSKALKTLPPEVEVVVSFADPAFGHVGVIYQATNFCYLGTTKDDYHYVASNGTYVHKRVPWNRSRSSGLTEEDQAIDMGLILVRDPPKYRYALPRSRRARKALEAKALPYPKRP